MSSHQEPDYLLSDEEFAKLMEREFAKDGRPQNAIAKKKLWNRLQKKTSPRKLSWLGGSLLVAALALFMVNRPQPVDETKSGQDASDYEITPLTGSGRMIQRQAGESIRLAVNSRTAVTFSIFASGPQILAPVRLKEGQILEAEQTAQLAFTAEELAAYDRVCLLAGADAKALATVESMAELLWTKLDDKHCLSIQ